MDGLARHVTAQRPAALYVGSALLPRHVALLVPDPGVASGGLLVHDPGSGTVVPLDARSLATGRLRIGGWAYPWWLIGPVATVHGTVSRPASPVGRGPGREPRWPRHPHSRAG
jgi:hypothetical protein